MGVTSFDQHTDNGIATLGAGGKPAGATSFAAATGKGPLFVAATGRLVLVQQAGWDAARNQISDTTKSAQYTFGSRSGDNFAGVAVAAGFADLSFAPGDIVLDAITRADLVATQGALNAIEATGANAPPSGVLKGSAGAFAAAVPGTDFYQPGAPIGVGDLPAHSTALLTSGLLAAARGGTGVDASAAANGKVLIGTGAGLALANLTAGSGVTITNGSGTITLAAAGGSGTVTSVGLSMPTGFTVTSSPITGAGTLAVTTAISGLVKGSAGAFAAATPGTDFYAPGSPISAADLPAFVASGASHAKGAVPDPGATAGTTHYLREDGSWAVPPGSSGSPGGSSGQLQYDAAGSFGGLGGSVVLTSGNLLTLSALAITDTAAVVQGITGQTGPLFQVLRFDGLQMYSANPATATVTINNILASGQFLAGSANLQQTGLRLPSAAFVGWSTSAINTATIDTELVRAAAGIVGSAGAFQSGAASVQTPTSSSTIAITTTLNATTITAGVIPLNPAAAVTGMILAAGSQNVRITLLNQSAFSITFAASGSNVSTGSSCVIAAGMAKAFTWDATSSLWRPES